MALINLEKNIINEDNYKKNTFCIMVFEDKFW